jgi:hypothetical protein
MVKYLPPRHWQKQNLNLQKALPDFHTFLSTYMVLYSGLLFKWAWYCNAFEVYLLLLFQKFYLIIEINDPLILTLFFFSKI